jgi:hypothetical protein
MAMLAFDGQSALWFTDSDTGGAITGAQVTIGDDIMTTDAEGLVIFDALPDGKYGVTMEKRGYITLEDEFTTLMGKIIFNKFSVPPASALKLVKIVLDWGADPQDLDLHLEKERGSGGTSSPAYHISYRDTKKSADGNVWLDRDDTSGYGPETITINNLDPRAIYHIYVHNYSNRSQSANRSLAGSSAIVRVYMDNKLRSRASVTPGKTGVTWYAFDIENGVVKPANRWK